MIYEIKVTVRLHGATKADYVERIITSFSENPQSELKIRNITEDECYRNYRTRGEKHYRKRIDDNTWMFVRVRKTKF